MWTNQAILVVTVANKWAGKRQEGLLNLFGRRKINILRGTGLMLVKGLQKITKCEKTKKGWVCLAQIGVPSSVTGIKRDFLVEINERKQLRRQKY